MSEHYPSIAAQSRALAEGAVSSRALVEHYLAQIAQHNGALNAYITIEAEAALAAADAADAARAAGDSRPLLGVPMAVKDLFMTAGTRTTCGSKMLHNFVAPYDATVVQKLDAAGLVRLGKLNMDEFAMGSSNENSYFGAVKNPWDLGRVPGGSSGGSAAAVAAGLAPAALGSDTGGSIRQPAALCGITGIKPTYGRVSRYGMVAFASSFDQCGPMARSAEDCALLLNVLSGHDPRDSTSIDCEAEDFTAHLQASLQGLRVGVPSQARSEDLGAGVREALETALQVLVDAGAELVDIELPVQRHGVAAYYVIAPAEASSNLSRFDGVRFGHRCEAPSSLEDLYCRSRGEGFGPEVQRRIMVGTYVLSEGYFDAYYLKAQRVRRLISDEFVEAFSRVDVIAGPTTPTPAFALGSGTEDPVQMYLNDIFTVTANLAGIPGVSVPCGLVDGLPVGMQLLGPHFGESKLLNVAHQFQQHSDWHQRRPRAYQEV